MLSKDKKYTVELAPNGKAYEENDIKFLMKNGLTREQAIEVLKKDKKYTSQMVLSEDNINKLMKEKNLTREQAIDKTEEKLKGPNGKVYEQNDIDYLVKNGYTKEQAIEILSKDKKYTAQMVLSEDNINKLMKEKNITREQAIEELFKGNKEQKPIASANQKRLQELKNIRANIAKDLSAFLSPTRAKQMRQLDEEIKKLEGQVADDKGKKNVQLEKPETSVDRLAKKDKTEEKLKGPNGKVKSI